MNEPRRYVIIKPRAGGVAFWRSMAYCLREGTYNVLRLWLHSKAALYLFPVESIDLNRLITWNYMVANIEEIKWSWDEQEEITIEKKKVKYTDEWGYQGEADIITVRTKEKEYVVYPNAKIKQLLGEAN